MTGPSWGCPVRCLDSWGTLVGCSPPGSPLGQGITEHSLTLEEPLRGEGCWTRLGAPRSRESCGSRRQGMRGMGWGWDGFGMGLGGMDWDGIGWDGVGGMDGWVIWGLQVPPLFRCGDNSQGSCCSCRLSL